MRMYKRGMPGHLLGCMSLAFLSPATLAQEPEEEVRVLRAIDVREILPAAVEHAPGAASMLTDHEIEELRPFTLTEALDFIPGIRTIQDDVLNRRANIGIRGAPPRRCRKVLLLEDGMPINAATYLDPDCHYQPPMERLERIDVLKGAGQIVHGPINNHGIINFRNKRPTPYPETTAEVGLGTPFTFKRHAMHRNTVGNVGYVLSYSGAEADGVFDSEEITFDDMYGAVYWTPHAAHEFSAAFTYFREHSMHDERNLSVEEFAIDPRGKLRLNEGAEFNNFNIEMYKGQLTHNFFATDRLTLSSKFFGSYMDRPRLESRDDGPGNPGGFMVGRLRDYKNFGLETRAEYADVHLFGLRHAFQAGIRGEHQIFNDDRSEGAIGEVLDFGNRGDTVTRRRNFRASALSVFIQDAMQYGDWTVTPGLRFETYRQKREDKPPETPRTQSDTNTLLMPGISFFYDGFEATQMFAGVHRGYTPAIARNEDFPLTPEIGINSQIGLRSGFFTGLTFEVAGFYNLIEDTLIRDTVTDQFGNNIFVNAGDSSMLGVDVGLRFDSNAFYPASPYNVFAMGAYTYVDARFDEGPLKGNRVPLVSEHSGSFTLGLEHTAGWQISGTVSHLGSFFTDVENTRNFFPTDDHEIEGGRVPSHTLFSARASYKLPGTNATLWVQGRNLTNKLFITDVNDGLRPGSERMVIAGVNVKFF